MNKNTIVDVLLEDQIQSQSTADNSDSINTAFVIGQKVFIRTITHHFTGRIKQVLHGCGQNWFLQLEEAAWIASDGRFMQAIEEGQLDEVEPVTCPVLVSIASIVDVYPWNHPLPRTQR